MMGVLGAFREYANAPKKTQEHQNMQGVPSVVSVSTAFVLGCCLLCDKVAMHLNILYKDQIVNGLKNGTSESSRI
jgi:hypothetical protein